MEQALDNIETIACDSSIHTRYYYHVAIPNLPKPFALTITHNTRTQNANVALLNLEQKDWLLTRTIQHDVYNDISFGCGFEYTRVHTFNGIHYYLFIGNASREMTCVNLGTRDHILCDYQPYKTLTQVYSAYNCKGIHGPYKVSGFVPSIPRELVLCNEYFYHRGNARVYRFNLKYELTFSYSIKAFLGKKNPATEVLACDTNNGVLLIAVFSNDKSESTEFLVKHVHDTLFLNYKKQKTFCTDLIICSGK
jgi:hypothetical protein